MSFQSNVSIAANNKKTDLWHVGCKNKTSLKSIAIEGSIEDN